MNTTRDIDDFESDVLYQCNKQLVGTEPLLIARFAASATARVIALQTQVDALQLELSAVQSLQRRSSAPRTDPKPLRES